jgi:hypothetical protein
MNKSNPKISSQLIDIDRCLEEINNLNTALKAMNKSSNLAGSSLALIARIVRLQIAITAKQYQVYVDSRDSDTELFRRAKNEYSKIASAMIEEADAYQPEMPQDLTGAGSILNQIQTNASARSDLDHINQLANETAEEYDPLIPMVSREQRELWHKTKEQQQILVAQPNSILSQIKAKAAQTAGESPEPSPAAKEAQSTKLRKMLADLANGTLTERRSRRRKT